MEYGEKFIKAVPLTPALKNKYGDKGTMSLDPGKAYAMERAGQIRIVYDDPIKQTKHILSKIDPHDYFEKHIFSTSDKIKVAWIQDNEILGGAELSNLQCLKIGINCGFDIVCITPSQFMLSVIKKADIIIINNFYKFLPHQEKILLDYLKSTNHHFIIYSHDMRDLTKMKERSWLYKKSLFNIFISPKHEEKYKIYDDNINVILPLAFDVDKYTIDDTIEREKNSVLVPTIMKNNKNIQSYKATHPEFKYYTIGVRKDGFGYFPKINNEFIYKTYNRFEYIYHCPEKFWTGDRVLFEAQLCGCKTITNENVGHCSWNFGNDIEKIRKELIKAPFTLWKIIEESIENNSIS